VRPAVDKIPQLRYNVHANGWNKLRGVAQLVARLLWEQDGPLGQLIDFILEKPHKH